jgi:hypothetical protein
VHLKSGFRRIDAAVKDPFVVFLSRLQASDKTYTGSPAACAALFIGDTGFHKALLPVVDILHGDFDEF